MVAASSDVVASPDRPQGEQGVVGIPAAPCPEDPGAGGEILDLGGGEFSCALSHAGGDATCLTAGRRGLEGAVGLQPTPFATNFPHWPRTRDESVRNLVHGK